MRMTRNEKNKKKFLRFRWFADKEAIKFVSSNLKETRKKRSTPKSQNDTEKVLSFLHVLHFSTRRRKW